MKVAIYVRVSTRRQQQAETIEEQIERLRTYSLAQGWNLREEYIFRDDGYSGKKMSRPGLDNLRDLAAMGEIEMVLITDPDRLARKYIYQVLILEELKQSNCRVKFLDRPMNDEPHDRLLLQIRGAVAEYEHSLIVERMRRGRLRKINSGQLLPWTRIPYGYIGDAEYPRDPNRIAVNEIEAEIIRQIFYWYIDIEKKMSLRAIADRLTTTGIPTPTNKKAGWNPATIRGILKNKAYTGKVLKFQIPAIITQSCFEQAQVRLKLNQRRALRNNNKNDYLLRGLINCGRCGLQWTGRSGKGYRYYLCKGKNEKKFTSSTKCDSHYAAAEELERIVWQDICELMMNHTMIACSLQRAQNGRWLPQQLLERALSASPLGIEF